MKRTQCSADAGRVSELAIVDTFTKLIFEDESGFSTPELEIIAALRLVDGNLLSGSLRDMGRYLRALGVGEMIALVSQVNACLAPVGSRQRKAGPGELRDRPN